MILSKLKSNDVQRKNILQYTIQRRTNVRVHATLQTFSVTGFDICRQLY